MVVLLQLLSKPQGDFSMVTRPSFFRRSSVGLAALAAVLAGCSPSDEGSLRTVASEAGPAGPQGPAGADGADGARGPAGPQGPAGADGADGARGPAGPQGPQGVTGPAGPQGAAGSAGESAVKIAEQSVCFDPNDDSGPKLCKIGMKGPAGGLIFFIDYMDQYPGFDYLEAAPASYSVINIPWSTSHPGCGADLDANCQTNSIYVEGFFTAENAALRGGHRGLGAGRAATDLIIARHAGVDKNTYAAGRADDYVSPDFMGNTYSDWYLPSERELLLMYENLYMNGVGGFFQVEYWSSSENNASRALTVGFGYAAPNDRRFLAKSDTNYNNHRPVRSF